RNSSASSTVRDVQVPSTCVLRLSVAPDDARPVAIRGSDAVTSVAPGRSSNGTAATPRAPSSAAVGGRLGSIGLRAPSTGANPELQVGARARPLSGDVVTELVERSRDRLRVGPDVGGDEPDPRVTGPEGLDDRPVALRVHALW